jgi:allene oxide cyclase
MGLRPPKVSGLKKGTAVKRTWVVLPLAGLLLSAAAFAIASSPRVSGPTRIHVIERPLTDVVTDTGASGDSAGDLLTFHNRLYRGGNKVGTDQGQCIRISPNKGTWECAWTNALSDGHISVEGPFNDNHGSVLTVTGGSGAYKNARGTMHLKFRDNGNFDFIFHLIP